MGLKFRHLMAGLYGLLAALATAGVDAAIDALTTGQVHLGDPKVRERLGGIAFIAAASAFKLYLTQPHRDPSSLTRVSDSQLVDRRAVAAIAAAPPTAPTAPPKSGG